MNVTTEEYEYNTDGSVSKKTTKNWEAENPPPTPPGAPQAPSGPVVDGQL